MTPQVFIGWDPREQLAYDVARSSLLRHCPSAQVIALKLENLKPIFRRPIEHKDGKLWCPISQAPMATEFAISRFCVPFLQKSGWALFMDCDVLVRSDIEDLFKLADRRYAVMCVKHPNEVWEKMILDVKGPNVDRVVLQMVPDTKMDGQVQTFYQRKNWSSVVLWNVSHPSNKKLNLAALNTWPGRDLHAFKWLKDEEIGELPPEWNYLVGVTREKLDPKIVHFTLGTPNMAGYENCEFAKEWHDNW